MSIWVMGVGAGLTYMYMKQTTFSGSIESAKRKYESRHQQQPADTEFSVSHMQNVSDASTSKAAATPSNISLSKGDQSSLNNAGSSLQAEQRAYDRGIGQAIDGLYMEQTVPQI